jgi:crossover junction endodeoxyribonuclease RuvC
MRSIAAQGRTRVVIEEVHAMPKQGVASTFRFGAAFGVAVGVIQATGLPMEFVQPAQWKKRAGVLRTAKDYARTRALELYPHADLARKRDQGRADALLIARYGPCPA